MPHHTTQIVDTIPSNEFRRRFSHYVGRLRDDGDVIIIRRGLEDQVYLVTEADWAMIEQALAEVRETRSVLQGVATVCRNALRLPLWILDILGRMYRRLIKGLGCLSDRLRSWFR